MTEIFRPINLFCGVGKTTATILVPAGEELHDNTDGFVENSCSGCREWPPEKIKDIESELEAEWGKQSGVREDRAYQLQQLLVDRPRFKGGKSKIVVAYCIPVGHC